MRDLIRRLGRLHAKGWTSEMTVARKRRGPYRKGIRRREQILDAALEVFTEHGDRGASLQEIADRVGVKGPSLMYYFASREELLLAVLERRDTLDTELAKGARQPVEAVARSVRQGIEQPGLVKLFAALSTAAVEPAHRGHEFFAERYRRINAEMERGISRDQQAGVARSDESAGQMAQLFIAVIEGLQKQWLMDDSVDMLAAVETFMRLCGYSTNSHADMDADR